MRRAPLVAIAWAALLAGCLEDNETRPDPADAEVGVEPDGDAPDAMPDVGPDALPDAVPDAAPDVLPDAETPMDAIEWGPCPAAIPNTGNPTCATTTVPLQWTVPDGPTIDVITLRYAADGESVGQLWMLDGGPGGSGIAFADFGPLRDFTRAGYDVFVPMHRGTGLSTPLDCDIPRFAERIEDALEPCGADLWAQWGEGLAGFRSAEAAADLGHLAGRVNAAEGGRLMVYGISYGTYWGLRYLRAFPDQADGVILDGVLDLQAEVWINGALAEGGGDHLMALCAEQPGCNGAFDRAPREAVERVFADLDMGSCPPLAGIPSEDMAGLMGLLIIIGPETRPLVPAFFARAARCDAQDAEELSFFLDAVFDNLFGGGFRPSQIRTPLDWPRRRFQRSLDFNDALYFAVLMADLVPPWRLDPIDVFEASLDLRFNGPPDNPASMLDAWPEMPLPEGHTEAPVTDTPLLLTQGLFDMQTVPGWAERAAGAFAGDHQTLITLPYGGHGAIFGNPTVDGEECGLAIILDFLDDPRAALDLGCLDRLEAPDLAGERPDTQDISELFFGTPQLMPGG